MKKLLEFQINLAKSKDTFEMHYTRTYLYLQYGRIEYQQQRRKRLQSRDYLAEERERERKIHAYTIKRLNFAMGGTHSVRCVGYCTKTNRYIF